MKRSRFSEELIIGEIEAASSWAIYAYLIVAALLHV